MFQQQHSFAVHVRNEGCMQCLGLLPASAAQLGLAGGKPSFAAIVSGNQVVLSRSMYAAGPLDHEPPTLARFISTKRSCKALEPSQELLGSFATSYVDQI